MASLIDLQQTIQPADVIASPLSFTLLALTYHSYLPAILYALYATNYNSSSPSSPYSSYFLLIYNSTSRARVTNLTFSLPSSTSASITATSSLFLVQTNNKVLLHPMQNDLITPNASTVLLAWSKSFSYSATVRYKCSGAFKNMFAYSDGSYLYFIKSTGGSAPSSIYFALPSTVSILDLTLSDQYLLITWPGSLGSISINIINCVTCVFNYVYTSGTTMPASMYQTITFTASPTFKVIAAKADNSYRINSASALWLLVDSIAKKQLFEASNLSTSTLGTISLGSNGDLVTNYHYTILTNSSACLYLGNYSLSNHDTQTFCPSTTETVSLAAISNDSERVALHFDTNRYTIHLYMLVENCSQYETQLSGSTCSCLSYDSNNLCKSIYSSTVGEASSSQAVPTYGLALIGLVGVIVGVVVVILIYRCCVLQAKEGRRKSWKYNAKELMSFEV